MASSVIFVLTDKGHEELKTRKYKVPMHQRRVLILVDGKSDINSIKEKGHGMPGIEESLGVLEADGYISKASGHDRLSLKSELLKIIKEVLGKSSDKVLSKLEKVPDSAPELRSAMAECKKLVKLTISESKAEELLKKCNEFIEKMQ
ncbi:MAG: hypothetical protein JSV21_07945 [Nitrospirota bacterium]|nr:MAG: hypothetical protein JSV21_07945 [Nitrospirota bacterium]